MELKAVIQSLTLRLFLLIVAVIGATFGAYAFVNIRTASASWEESAYAGAQRSSDLIQRSTHYGMLLNRKEDVHQTIRAIADAPGVEGVRIYDKEGSIIFSAADDEIGTRVDLEAEACVSCHTTEGLRVSPGDDRVRVFERPDGERVLGLIDPIENAPECSSADCHAHAPDQSILGVLDVRMSLAESDRRLATVEGQAVTAAIVMALLAGLLSAIFILRVVRRPVKELISGAERVASGDLDTEILVKPHTEIGQLASAFNDMTRDLRTARDEVDEWSGRLEARLKERTEELGRTQRQVAHMDKMASLGQLAATVAHELNNPLAGILNYAKLIGRTREEDGPSGDGEAEIDRYLELIQKEANRSGSIVRNLVAFARPAGADHSLQSINAIVERSAMLIRHHLELSEIQLRLHPLGGNEHLICDANQIEQGLVAILMNAVEAMPDGGNLNIAIEDLGESIRVSITDTGVGIPEEALPQIFEPFFTSKTNTEGAGLGLAVAYGIVQRHGGLIEVESEIDKGTTFRITLPRQPVERADSERTDHATETLEPSHA